MNSWFILTEKSKTDIKIVNSTREVRVLTLKKEYIRSPKGWVFHGKKAVSSRIYTSVGNDDPFYLHTKGNLFARVDFQFE
ncbi:hypothetical protein EMIT07CA2_30486 [Brevibacillus sp. IT-7CA2]